MDIKATVAAVSRLGLTVNVQSTGHPDYIRGFVKNGTVSLGRITFFEGRYSHVKWYLGDYGPVGDFDKFSYGWSYLLLNGKTLTDELWQETLTEAKRLSEEDYQRKLDWRRKHPASVNNQGKPRSRGKLQRDTTRKFLRQLLFAD
ncbi:Uncharacterised protein [Serratia quinivorans]|uniref:hypothetical protein n=1 Tax=Serratia quinivorans TaxID=137545 RepID=UPI002179AB4B|nr:hypothetical protein [Serratia quinivorans]CAI0907620.1 Uncharacterised protein [Serratia quinivorans]CAI0925131.1 Uncharacterised protein [Serratia quinivorans]CAI1714456.1 Uncharacterised protein [Serratia quinivorans]CAI2068850.1 Uncharacterised protein [Serratia quinivorans]CAI2089590.1 Uncharacterised protein [Serratia quinivorans]